MTFVHCWWECKNGVPAIENDMEIPQIIKIELP